MNKKIIILDDTCKSSSGGTAMTLAALKDSIQDIEFNFIETKELTSDRFNSISPEIPWIIGNINNFTYESAKALFNIFQLRKFVKIEFDYGFCRYRCKQGYEKFTKQNTWNPFDDRFGSKTLKNFYILNRYFSKKIFYMSEAQMELHNKMMPFSKIDSSKQIVLGSCFSPAHMMNMINLNMERKSKVDSDNRVYAIVDGNPGWHSEAKGIKNSIIFAKENKLNYSLIKQSNYDNFINQLSKFYGCIFLPNIHDTCPRLTIECKMIGLDLITNENAQHIKEPWFSKTPEEIGNHILSKIDMFRYEIDSIL